MKKFLKKIVIKILRSEAERTLYKHKPKVVGITGSVGKTSTKDNIFLVMEDKFDVRKNKKSYNSEFGAPLTILDLSTAWSSPIGWTKNIIKGFFVSVFSKKYPEWLVLEMGIGEPGDLKELTSWIKPDIGVITGVGEVPVHVEFFKTPEDLIAEKKLIAKETKEDGFVILNRDNDLAYSAKDVAKAKVLTYGFSPEADIRATNMSVTYKDEDGRHEATGVTFRVDHNGVSTPIRLRRAAGIGYVYSALGAIGVGIAQGINMIDIAESFTKFEPTPGRLNFLPGIKNTTIIDDSYNASPMAVEAALDSLANIESSGRKIAVLGGMEELGSFTQEAHYELGKQVAKVADVLITVGEKGHIFGEGALAAGMMDENIVRFENSVEAGIYLQNFIDERDTLLMKGSQSARMEQAVLEIMRDPGSRHELLCRQDDGWEKR